MVSLITVKDWQHVGKMLTNSWHEVGQLSGRAGWRRVGGGLAAGWRSWRRGRLAGFLALTGCVWRLAGWCSGLQCSPMVFESSTSSKCVSVSCVLCGDNGVDDNVFCKHKKTSQGSDAK